MILGLDISTRCIGWCIFNHSKEFIDMGYIDFPKDKKDMISKASYTKDRLLMLILKYEIDSIVIEENLQAFRPGLSSAKTLLTLARFNGIVSYLCYDVFDIIPTYLNVNSARKKAGVKIDRKIKIDTKKQVMEWVKSDLSANGSTYAWNKRTLKRGPRAGMVVLQEGCFDAADAYVICKAACV